MKNNFLDLHTDVTRLTSFKGQTVAYRAKSDHRLTLRRPAPKRFKISLNISGIAGYSTPRIGIQVSTFLYENGSHQDEPSNYWVLVACVSAQARAVLRGSWVGVGYLAFQNLVDRETETIGGRAVVDRLSRCLLLTTTTGGLFINEI